MKLIQNIDVYAPQHLGKKDVLIINDKIVKIKDAGSICADGFLSEAEMINGEGLLLTPGFIDCHVHVLGGGGEGGFANRTPEATMEGLTKFGVTTVVTPNFVSPSIVASGVRLANPPSPPPPST